MPQMIFNFSSINAGFGSTLRQGNITHHEYIQVNLPAILCLNVYMMAVPKLRSYRSAKGRDVGLNQIALFEGTVAGGNGEQVLSRDVSRLGQLFDFFRMLSFYFTTIWYCFLCPSHTLICYAKQEIGSWFPTNWAISWIAYKILIEWPMSMYVFLILEEWCFSFRLLEIISVFCTYFTFLALDCSIILLLSYLHRCANNPLKRYTIWTTSRKNCFEKVCTKRECVLLAVLFLKISKCFVSE